MAELVDAPDSKSGALKGVRVRVPLPAPISALLPLQPKETRMITDAQVHIWNANTPDDPWDPGAQSHLPDPMPAERMLGLMDEAGIDRAVIRLEGK